MMENEKAISHAMEDYLRTIHKLSEQAEKVSTSAIADRLDVAPASVTKMLKRLAELELIKYEPYKGVKLTAFGEKTALAVVRQHRLVELFLHDILGVPWDRVHEEAHRLEHVISPYLQDRMVAVLGNPRVDPHGQPIPSKDGSMLQRDLCRLSEVEVGFSGCVAEIEDDDAELLRYVGEKGVYPNTQIKVLSRDRFGGGVSLLIDGEEVSLGSQATPQIWLFQEEEA